jgi:hypothetical protein
MNSTLREKPGQALEHLTAMAGAGAQREDVSHQSEADSMRTAGQAACEQAVDTPVGSSLVTASPPKASPECGERTGQTGQAAVTPPCPSRA